MTPPSHYHISRMFGRPDDYECPCPRAVCGYVIGDARHPDCEQHALDKTIRDAHPAEQCPGAQGDHD